MLVIVRASDGAAFTIAPQDLTNISSLDQLRHDFFSPLLEIAPDNIIAMNEEGAQLRDDSVPSLALLAAVGWDSSDPSAAPPPPTRRRTSPGASHANVGRMGSSGDEGRPEVGEKETRIFVFDRAHLDDDPERVAAALAITEDMLLDEPELSPQDPLSSHVALSWHNLSTLRAVISSISLQCASLALALSNLTRVNTGTSTSLNVYRTSSHSNMEAWSKLLEGWEGSMEAIAKVAVVGGLLGRSGAGHSKEPSTGSSGTTRKKERFLGDYVSPEKMLAVKEGCAKVFNDLKSREEALQTVLDEVLAGTAQVAADFDATSRDLEDLEACENDACAAHLRIEDLVRTGSELTDQDLLADCFEELSHIDAESRDRIRFIAHRKNAMTRYLVLEMQRISNLQSEVAQMPSSLGALDHDARTKTDNFKHIARLDGLIPAYIATVVEVVRRREYARLLNEHSTNLTQSILGLSTAERARRTSYRANFSGKLPWEVKGLGSNTDEAIPSIDFDVKNFVDELPDLNRDVLEGLRQRFAELESSVPTKAVDHPLRRGHRMLEGLITELETLDEEFVHLGKGTPSPSIVDHNAPKSEDLERQVRELEEAKEALERELQAERSGREEELAQLNLINGQLTAARQDDLQVNSSLREQIASLEKSQAQIELERKSWERERADWTKERRDSKSLFDEVVKRANQASTDLREASSSLADLERQLQGFRTTADDLTRQLQDVEGLHSTLRLDHDAIQQELQRARRTINEMETHARNVESNHRDVASSLADKERLLRDERSEHELGKAVFDKELNELRREIASKDADLVLNAARLNTLEEVSAGLRQQIARWEVIAALKETDVDEAKKEVESAKRAREEGIVGVQRDLVAANRIARSALKLAGTLRDENVQLTAILMAPTPSKSDLSSSDNADKADRATDPVSPLQSALVPAPLDYEAGHLQDLLVTLQRFDSNLLTEAVKAKVEGLTSVTKKWSKEAKAYRERLHRATASANDKIAFRNFTKGDLALFLPTRNSAVPVWAAFNVSFPHHFLSATGSITEQIKSREWIVARIISLTEKVADVKDPSSNPYLLAPGTKFFMLEVEAWSSREPGTRSRKHSSAEKTRSTRPEERRSYSTGHIRHSRSESSTLPPPAAPPAATSTSAVDPPPLPSAPDFRRAFSVGLPSNATDLARSEFAIVEEEHVESRPPSPATLRQPVPSSEETYVSPSASSPSALARALAREPAPSPSPSPVVSESEATGQPSHRSRRRSDPFSAGPFGSLPTDAVVITPSATDFEPTITPAGAVPAFLPSKSSSGSGRVFRPSLKPKPVEPGTSPASTAGSFVTYPRSTSSGSSILSASIHRRSTSIIGISPPGTSKALATQETQDSASRWTTLTEELASASMDDAGRKTQTMTIGRASKGWPSSSSSVSGHSKSSSVLDSFTMRKAAPEPTGTLAASEILKALKPGKGGGAGASMRK